MSLMCKMFASKYKNHSILLHFSQSSNVLSASHPKCLSWRTTLLPSINTGASPRKPSDLYILHPLFFLQWVLLPSRRPKTHKTGSASFPPGLRPFPDIGGSRKRKPPPMHRMRRLREPGKMQRRRLNCIVRAVTLLCVFPLEFLRLPSDASHVRRSGGRGATALPKAAVSSKPPYLGSRLWRPSLRGKSVSLRQSRLAPFMPIS